MPALASSAARIPPAAPTPTMTTSVFSVAMASRPLGRGLALRLQTHHGHALERVLALHVGLREHGLRAREADELPAGEILVAAIDRVREHAFHRVGAQRVEEGLRGRPGKAGGLAGLERRDHRVLARRIEPR